MIFQCSIKYLIDDPEINEIAVDLKQNYLKYSFSTKYPEKTKEIDRIFNQTTEKNSHLHSLATILKKPYLDTNDLTLLKKLKVAQLSADPTGGVILEHPDFPNWLIKKNYGYFQEDELLNPIRKLVEAENIPSWMLPKQFKDLPSNKSLLIHVPNDVINPLRVVMLERGQKIINAFKLKHIKVAKEYLHQLPNCDDSLPIHHSLVVISKKEPILNRSESLNHYVKLAKNCPEKLQQIARDIVRFISALRLTDSHIDNFPFLNDGSDTVIAIDGEPVGGLADINETRMVESLKEFDPGFFSLVGLQKFQSSICQKMRSEKIDFIDILKVQEIFDTEIKIAHTEIIAERSSLKAFERLTLFQRTLLWRATIFVVNIFQNEFERQEKRAGI